MNLEVFGAREHNLKNIDVSIPRNKLIVITGVSGSGKSSLAFDTIYAEGQRRYMETFAAYTRTLLDSMKRPDVDKINGLSPVIAITQKTTSQNPKSTVGTATDVYDFMRLLYAKCAKAFSYIDGKQLVKQTEDSVFEYISQYFLDKEITIFAPVVRSRKGFYTELFAKISRLGFSKARVDGKVVRLKKDMQLDRYKIHDIQILIDTITIKSKDFPRLKSSLTTAWLHGNSSIVITDKADKIYHFSKNFMDPTTGLSYEDPSPNTFSFNSHYGACPTCQGIGHLMLADFEKLIPNSELSIENGAIPPLKGYKNPKFFEKLKSVLQNHGYKLSTPIKLLSQDALNEIIYGTQSKKKGSIEDYTDEDDYDDLDEDFEDLSEYGNTGPLFSGILKQILKDKKLAKSDDSQQNTYQKKSICPDCKGGRLTKEALSFKIEEKSIADLANMNLQDLYTWFQDLTPKLSDRDKLISSDLLKEIIKRTKLLLDMGVGYLHLNRTLNTLSGGESQRIRLATQIGTQLVGVLYILDEPSIGLHQQDNMKLIAAMKSLRDLGNSVIVVEHDKDIMLNSDYILDIGPSAGIHGGKVIAAGELKDFLKQTSETADFLSNKKSITIPRERRQGNGKSLHIAGCTGFNLKSIDIAIPLGTITCITGPSGSGKSTLIYSTLIPAIKNNLYKSNHEFLPYKDLIGLENIDNLVEVDQGPIGRTPRSNPATYTGVFDPIRNLYTQLPESKVRGYAPGRFSFNVKGGRCADCEGGGVKLISMNFLDDVHVQCESCQGKRYNRETLEVRYNGCSISDILDMTVDTATKFFTNHPIILKKLAMLQDVGLGYITLGQHATTLSGGEAQRIKLASELCKRGLTKTLYILDEPSIGLHFSDIQKLIKILNNLVEKGNTILIIEHNMDIIKIADYIFDLGPESGPEGGYIVAQGTPEQLCQDKKSITGYYLKKELES